MNSEIMRGRWDQLKCELKTRWGKFTDDDIARIQGDYEKLVGVAEERYGEKKDEVLKWAEEWHPRSGRSS